MNRTQALSAAANAVTGQRPQDYGSSENSFGRIAALWSAYSGHQYTAADVALMLGLLKIARLKNNPQHADSWVDLAGYAACGAEIGTGGQGDD